MNNQIKPKRQIHIFDTTLRDGQQCPGAGMNLENNLKYAELAAKVQIDILEAGFPSASSEDFKIVKSIVQMYSQMKSSPKVAALCQLRESQIITTIESLSELIPKDKARLHVYVPVDPELMAASLSNGPSQEQIQKDLESSIQLATAEGLEVEFSPEGYSRMANNFDFVTELIETAISAGATIINCPDTIGGACYLQGQNYFVNKMIEHSEIIKSKFPNNNIIWSAHCHNDYGLALANTMDSIFKGPVTQVEGCFNGIGERAGNVSLEQCIMYIKAFGDNELSKYDYYTNANAANIKSISDFVATNMLSRQAHWPISGDNAARHSSGGHTNAILKNPQAYQPFNPKDVGQEISFVFGPLSGSNHAQSIIKKHGYACDQDEKTKITQFIKDFYSTRRKGLTEKEFMQAYFEYRAPLRIEGYEYKKGKEQTTIKIKGQYDNDQIVIQEQGQTALTALHKGLRNYLPNINIESFRSNSKGKGRHAMSQSTIVIVSDNNTFQGQSEDVDIEVSALKALINAVNNALVSQQFAHSIEAKVI